MRCLCEIHESNERHTIAILYSFIQTAMQKESIAWQKLPIIFITVHWVSCRFIHICKLINTVCEYLCVVFTLSISAHLQYDSIVLMFYVFFKIVLEVSLKCTVCLKISMCGDCCIISKMRNACKYLRSHILKIFKCKG